MILFSLFFVCPSANREPMEIGASHLTERKSRLLAIVHLLLAWYINWTEWKWSGLILSLYRKATSGNGAIERNGIRIYSRIWFNPIKGTLPYELILLSRFSLSSSGAVTSYV